MLVPDALQAAPMHCPVSNRLAPQLRAYPQCSNMQAQLQANVPRTAHPKYPHLLHRRPAAVSLWPAPRARARWQAASNGTGGKLRAGAALSAAANSRSFQGSLHDGIMSKLLTNSVYAPREDLVEDALILAVTRGMLILKGSPWAGKTSLLQLMFERASEVFSQVVLLKATGCPKGMTWDQFVYQELGQTWADLTCPRTRGKVLILIDDMQALYVRDPRLYESLWLTIKDVLQGGMDSPNAPGSDVCIIASALHEDSPLSLQDHATAIRLAGMMSFDIPDEHVVSMRPTLAVQLELSLPVREYHRLFTDTWARQDLPLGLLFSGHDTRDKIMELASGHVGLITLMLQRLYDGLMEARQREEDLDGLQLRAARAKMGLCDLLFRRLFRQGAFYDYLGNLRGFLEVNEASTETYELMLPLFLSANQPVAVRTLDYTLAARLKTLRLAGLVEVALHNDWGPMPPAEVYSLPTKLHLYYYRHQLLKYQPSRVDVISEPTSLEAVLRLALPRMSAQRLSTTLGKGVAWGLVEEERFQAEVVVALSSVLPRDWNVCPEIQGKHVELDSTKRLGLMITPGNWSLQLLLNGDDDLADHEARFRAGGDDVDFGWERYAVVDFRSYPYKQPRLREDQPNTFFVLFQDDQYRQAMMVHASTGREWLLELAP